MNNQREELIIWHWGPNVPPRLKVTGQFRETDDPAKVNCWTCKQLGIPLDQRRTV
jgi:hypothetical protein